MNESMAIHNGINGLKFGPFERLDLFTNLRARTPTYAMLPCHQNETIICAQIQ